jgi:hypothetical protein
MMGDPCDKAAEIGHMNGRLESVEKLMDKLAGAVEVISESITKLVGLEQAHTETRSALERAFKEIEKLQLEDKAINDKIVAIQIQLPLIAEGVTWIKRGVISTVGVVLLAGAKIVFGIDFK